MVKGRGKAAGGRAKEGTKTVLEPTAAGSFITLKLSPEALAQFGKSASQAAIDNRAHLNQKEVKRFRIVSVPANGNPPIIPLVQAPVSPHLAPSTANQEPARPPAMQTRGAWDTNRSNPKRRKTEAIDIKSEPDDDAFPLDNPTPAGKRATSNRKRKHPSHDPDSAVDEILTPKAVKRRRTAPNKKKALAFSRQPDVVIDEADDDVVSVTFSPGAHNHSDKENQDQEQEQDDMERPKLALKLSFAKPNDGFAKPATPASSPPAQTPKLKLKVNQNQDQDGSGKKRKGKDEPQHEEPVPTPSSAVPKIKLKTAGKPPAQSPATPGGLKLQAKGKIPKRHAGVGYDSELSDTEKDPVILEGFVLRMQPGPDCTYIKDHIQKGTMGTSKLQGGADIGITAFDDKGRRCLLRIRQNKYAATLVDLPTLIEGMKSWDRMRFIKSVDICQMMIVLGPVKSDDEAKTYPLPPGVEPKSYRYAHGLSAPMQFVRKRRFDRTKRTRVDEIEMVDRRVGQLLATDANAQHVSYETLDHDPRLDEDQYSESESGDEDEDAEGEEEDYFGHNGDLEDQEAHEPDEAEVNEFDQLFAGEDEDEDGVAADGGQAMNGTIDSSAVASSKADSPDVTGSLAPTTAPTPAGEASTPAAATPGTDGESDEDDDRDDREAQNEQDEQKSQLQERIFDLEGKITEQMELLKTQSNLIIKRRLAQKIKDLQKDVDMLRRELGEGGEDGQDDE